ncbi:MAG: hypothetical protein K5641_03875 [Lachnospiraceae bacterium]|nr:hypothetical protein [Lachnospiraceae bacterium]
MAINPIELNGAISRSQDYLQLKHGEDTKGLHDQQNFQATFHREAEHRLNQVRSGDQVRGDGKQSDARDQGHGQYAGDGGRRRPGEQGGKEDGKVIAKGTSSFDVKI